MAGRLTKYVQQIKAWMIEYAYVVTLCAVIAVIAGSALYTRQLREEQNAEIAAAAHAPETAERPAETQAPKPSPLPTIAPIRVRYDVLKSGNGATVWPLDGRILRGFDLQNAVYWEALHSYSVHAGIDIEGESGQSVRCASDGKVLRVLHDPMWGWRIIVDQTDGRRALYAGLSEAIVSEGENVVRGKEIGFLMDRIPCEAELPTHLHMELSRDEKAQDPEGMLPER